MYMKKKDVLFVKKSSKVAKRKSVVTNIGKSTVKKEMKLLGTKESKVLLKGSDKNDYIIIVQDGKSYFDLPIRADELHELYCLLERKFGEFIGYKIK